MDRRKVAAEFWVEGQGKRWRLSHESTSMKLFYCVGDLWTDKEEGAKIFPSEDAAVLVIDRFLNPR